MEPTVTFRHIDPNDALRKYALEKVARIERYVSSNVNEIHIVLSKEKRSHIAEIIVHVNRAQITAREVNEENMYTAVDLVMDKIERQAKRYKDKITSHKEQHKKVRQPLAAEEGSAQDDRPNIVSTQSVSLALLNVDEAIDQLEGSEDELVVFKEYSTEKVNVLYRRADGDLVLVETDNA